jgi:hypothetical protein
MKAGRRKFEEGSLSGGSVSREALQGGAKLNCFT